MARAGGMMLHDQVDDLARQVMQDILPQVLQRLQYPHDTTAEVLQYGTQVNHLGLLCMLQLFGGWYSLQLYDWILIKITSMIIPLHNLETLKVVAGTNFYFKTKFSNGKVAFIRVFRNLKQELQLAGVLADKSENDVLQPFSPN